jgi:translation elongation factor EF-1alpha
MIKLTEQNKNTKKISGYFKFLFDNCDTARYKDYNIDSSEATRSIEALDTIFKQCNTAKSSSKKKRKRIPRSDG